MGSGGGSNWYFYRGIRNVIICDMSERRLFLIAAIFCIFEMSSLFKISVWHILPKGRWSFQWEKWLVWLLCTKGEYIPTNTLKLLEKEFIMIPYVGVSYVSCKITKRSRTGFLVYLTKHQFISILSNKTHMRLVHLRVNL